MITKKRLHPNHLKIRGFAVIAPYLFNECILSALYWAPFQLRKLISSTVKETTYHSISSSKSKDFRLLTFLIYWFLLLFLLLLISFQSSAFSKAATLTVSLSTFPHLSPDLKSIFMSILYFVDRTMWLLAIVQHLPKTRILPLQSVLIYFSTTLLTLKQLDLHNSIQKPSSWSLSTTHGLLHNSLQKLASSSLKSF